MNTRLIVHLDESWPETPSAPWVVLDDRDRVVSEGHSEPRHWPAAQRCEAVLSAPQCSWLDTRLPAGGRSDQTRLLRYALEEQLLRDVDEQHLTVTARHKLDEGFSVRVLVCARPRLQRIVAQLKALGRPPQRITSALQQATLPPDSWSLSACPDGGFILNPAPAPAIAVDPDTVLPMLEHLLDRAAGKRPARLRVTALSGELPPAQAALEALATRHGVALETVPAPVWWQGHAQAADLLHGEFAARSSGGVLRQARAPLMLAALAAFIGLLALLGEVLWKAQQLEATEARLRRLFETAVPGTPAIAPAVQLRRALDEARARHGQLRESDFLTLLDSFADIGGNATRHAIAALEYNADNGTLQVRYDPTRLTQTELLQARLHTLGHDARAGSEPDSLIINRRVLP